MHVQYSTANYTVTYSMYVGYWGSLLIMIYCNEKFHC